MTTTVEAVYEAGVLRLLEPVNLVDGTHVAVTLSDPAPQERTDAAYLLTLPRTERRRILVAAAAAAAPLYEADLSLPAAERELTAFTALDGEPFLNAEGNKDAG